jgi:hypothetical protein
MSGKSSSLCPRRGCKKPRGRKGDTGACCGAHAHDIRMHAGGLISPPEAARILKSDRRTLVGLYDAGLIDGETIGGKYWLYRRSLAAYAWSCRRCGVDGCLRRVLGDEPGCNIKSHQRRGKRHSEKTKRKIGASQRHLRGFRCGICASARSVATGPTEIVSAPMTACALSS